MAAGRQMLRWALALALAPTVWASPMAIRAQAISPTNWPGEAPRPFPKGFLWGAATAAHQVEGGLNNDWTEWEKVPGHVAGGGTSAVGVQHFTRYEQDFDLAKAMGHNAHRISIEWSRIEPQEGQYDPAAIAHYGRVLKALRDRGLEPVVTLHHFTNPSWLAAKGGWAWAGAPEALGRFAVVAAKAYGGLVDRWITVNEPNVYAFKMHDEGTWPAGRQNRAEALRVMANLMKGHGRAYRALRWNDRQDADGDGTSSKVGFAHHVALFDPEDGLPPWSGFLAMAQSHFMNEVFNVAPLRAASTGRLRFQIPGADGVDEQDEQLAGSMSYVGINHYTRSRVGPDGSRKPTPGAPQTGMGWEIYPMGLARALAFAESWSTGLDGKPLPLLITEHGCDSRPGSGVDPARFLVRALQVAQRFSASGAPLEGYLHWTLMDNFEWADGYAPQFGLYHVDRTPGLNLPRIPTSAVPVFKAIARANALTPEVLRQHGDPALDAASLPRHKP